MTSRPIKIIEPSKGVFELYESFERRIREALPLAKTRLIGSFAVPMCGKSEIDVLVEVKNVEEAQKTLEGIGFSRGPLIDGEGFSRRKEDGIVCELHILNYGAKRISGVYDKVTRILKQNKVLRDQLASLKRSLNGKTEEEYKAAKSEFLKKYILK